MEQPGCPAAERSFRLNGELSHEFVELTATDEHDGASRAAKFSAAADLKKQLNGRRARLPSPVPIARAGRRR
jgi:hypothetical protein